MGLVALRYMGRPGLEIKPVSSALQGRFLTTGPPGKSLKKIIIIKKPHPHQQSLPIPSHRPWQPLIYFPSPWICLFFHINGIPHCVVLCLASLTGQTVFKVYQHCNECQPFTPFYGWTVFCSSVGVFLLFGSATQLVPFIYPPGMEPGSPAVKAGSPNHWTAREFPSIPLF